MILKFSILALAILYAFAPNVKGDDEECGKYIYWLIKRLLSFTVFKSRVCIGIMDFSLGDFASFKQ